MASIVGLYFFNRGKRQLFFSSEYHAEFRKYLACMTKDDRSDLVFSQARAFLISDFELKADRLQLSDDPAEPVVVAVVRNELERMRIFFAHYRRLGVRQFVVLDNGSDDGTLEYLVSQDGTRVYQTSDTFQTQKKEAWIEKLLVLTGYDRWYVVVDSDELLDYVGSEEHAIPELIQKTEAAGFKRIMGYMLDMYSEGPLFASKGEGVSILEQLVHFDPTGYYVSLKDAPDARRIYDEIYGGPRYRKFKTDVTLSKQAVFFFARTMLYRSSHYLYPQVRLKDLPVRYVLRHYKFLAMDKSEYERRVRSKLFSNNSSEYRKIMEQIGDTEVSLFHKESKRYENSRSLKGLPYLEEMKW